MKTEENDISGPESTFSGHISDNSVSIILKNVSNSAKKYPTFVCVYRPL